MNQVTLDPISASAVVPPGPADPNSEAATPSADVFRTALADQVRLAAPAVKGSATAPGAKPTSSVGDDKAQQTLEAKIKKMLDAGASPADVAATLASQLASSVAQSLDSPDADARAKLQAMFAAALAPPGTSDGVGGANADRARGLAQRFLRLEKLAASIAGRPNGQQRRIAGNLLDAQRAKDIPARTKTNQAISGKAAVAPSADASTQLVAAAALSGAQQATGQTATLASLTRSDPKLPAPAASATVAALAPTDPNRPADTPLTDATLGGPAGTSAALAGLRAPIGIAAGAADGRRVNLGSSTAIKPAAGDGDGRRVTLGSSTAIATGGDTGFGRILTRAALAADARLVSRAPAASGAPIADGTTLVGGTQPDATTSGTTASPGAAANAAASDTALVAFIKSFEAALSPTAETSAADKLGVHDTPASPAAALPAGRDGANAQMAFVPTVAPFTIERVGPTSAPAPAAAPEPVDHSAIADQVLRGAFMKNVGQSSEIRLSLVPDSLGDVSVKLVVEAGTVTAHIIAETPAVRDALIAAEPQLNKSLAEAGLKLSSFTVDLSGSGFAGFSQQQQGRSQNGGSRRSTSDADEAGADETLLEAIPSFSPSRSARPNAGDYNYLA